MVGKVVGEGVKEQRDGGEGLGGKGRGFGAREGGEGMKEPVAP